MSTTKVSAALMESGTKGADISSASSITIGLDGSYMDITGTTTIATMVVDAGRIFTLQFDGAVTLTHSSTLYLAGAANFTTEANDHLTFVAVAANDVRQIGAGLKDGGSPVASAPQFKLIVGSYGQATTGELAVTGVGFAPLMVMGMANSGDVANASWGWAVKTDAGFDDLTLIDQHGYAADTVGYTQTAILTLYHAAASSNLTPTSFDSDGVTFTRTKSSTPTLTFNYFLLFCG